MDITIYERDTSFNSRAQGYALTIQLNGMSALRKLNIEKDIKELYSNALLTSNKSFAVNQDGNQLLLLSGGKKRNLEISPQEQSSLHTVLPRQELRRILMENYEKESEKKVVWNREFKTFKEIDGRVVVGFENDQIECDVLFGCDGLTSGVRR